MKKKASSYLTPEDRKRRKREIAIAFSAALAFAFLVYIEVRMAGFGSTFPLLHTVLMFSLTNINLLLLLLLIFLVFRNLVKLLYDRKRRVMGAKLRTKLFVAFVTMTLVPTVVLFYFSISFLTSSIDVWFNLPVEQALENALHVGRHHYGVLESTHAFYLDRMAFQIKSRSLLNPAAGKELNHYLQTVLKAFNIDGIEVYDTRAKLLSQVLDPRLDPKFFRPLTRDMLIVPASPKQVHSVTEAMQGGELFRSIATVPFGVKPEDAEGFVVLCSIVAPQLVENIASINRGYEAYQQIKLLKKPIQSSYYLILSIVGSLVVFCAVWFSFYLAKSISIPIQELAVGAKRVAAGDLSVRIAPVGDDEIGHLVDVFNQMTHDLQNSRARQNQFAKRLENQNVEIEQRRQYMEIVLNHISTGVISLDENGFIATINASAETMLGIQARDLIGKNFRRLLKTDHLKLAENVLRSVAAHESDAMDVTIRLAVRGKPRSFLIHVNILRQGDGPELGYVVVFDDLTEQEKAQRAAAWREVARRIAHEVKNPLTPITLSAQRLQRRFSSRLNDPVFSECLKMIIDHVEIIRNLVNEFSTFSRFPAAELKPESIFPIVQDALKPYIEGVPHIRFDVEAPKDLPILNLDRRQIRQVLINLVENAICSIHGQGCIRVALSYRKGQRMLNLEVSDNGTGISDEHKIRIFEPDFSTKAAGMGLGLTIVHSIISDHHGTIRVEDNQPTGARFIIELPVPG